MRNLASTRDPASRYRVVQWATGNVGARALRRAIEHPAIEVVGLYVHSADKAGRDAGELAGIAPIGVAATNSIDDVIALRPDCVLYMPAATSADEICRLLSAGINVVTTRGDFHYPPMMEPTLRERVEAACREGDSSICSTGSSPGFSTEALPLVLASLQRSMKRLTINEYGDCSSRNSPDMLFQVMGFGEKPGRSVQARLDHLREAFGPSLALTADALGLPIDRVEATGAVGLARNDVHIAAGMVPAGTIAAQKTTIAGYRGDEIVISIALNWYISTDIVEDGEDWDLRESGWRLVMDGDAPLDVSIRYPVAPELYADMTPGLTAHRPVNIVPYLVEAPAGIRTSVDLPQIIARLA